MALTKSQSFQLAINNVARYGDTDVFPFPIDNFVFYDEPQQAREVLEAIDADFEGSLVTFPPVAVKSLAAVGYSGFRLAAQIDSAWNAYLLSLVALIASDIEAARVPVVKNTVFSYRFSPDVATGQLFNPGIGWVQYQEHSVSQAKNFDYVLQCDISDFYPRIYHHRLENALKKATPNDEAIRRIKILLFRIAEGVSYGLPIGGPAARLLSELLLNRVDRLLLGDEIVYCRFVDDYHIFAKTREEAYRHLVRLSELLQVNEGLSLQRTKTRILAKSEFLSSSNFALDNPPESPEAAEVRSFARLRLRYDPYSPTAPEDYRALKAEIEKFDIVGMLGKELAKSRIDEALTRKLLSAVRLLSPQAQNQIASSLVHNFDLLYPVFPAVMLLIRGVLSSLEDRTKDDIFQKLRDLIRSGSYITLVPANLSFALRVLSEDRSEETEALLVALFKQPLNMMLKRDIILIMAHRNADHWISSCLKQYQVLSRWEQRALIASSYNLDDEGKHWRESVKNQLAPFDRLIMRWAGDKKNALQSAWRVPI